MKESNIADGYVKWFPKSGNDDDEKIVRQCIVEDDIQLSKAILPSPLGKLTKDQHFHHPFTDYIASAIHLVSFDFTPVGQRGQSRTSTALDIETGAGMSI